MEGNELKNNTPAIQVIAGLEAESIDASDYWESPRDYYVAECKKLIGLLQHNIESGIIYLDFYQYESMSGKFIGLEIPIDSTLETEVNLEVVPPYPYLKVYIENNGLSAKSVNFALTGTKR